MPAAETLKQGDAQPGRIWGVRSVSKSNDMPVKKKPAAATQKGSRKRAVSKAEGKSPGKNVLPGKTVVLHKKKEALPAKGTPSRKPVPLSPAKKQTAKNAPAGKTPAPGTKKVAATGKAIPSKKSAPPATAKKQTGKNAPAGKAPAPGTKKVAATGKAAPSKKTAPPATAKKQTGKNAPAGKAPAPGTKKVAATGKAAPSKKPTPPAAVKKQPGKGEPDRKAEEQAGKKNAPAVKVKQSETKALPVEPDQLSDKDDGVAAEEIQPWHGTVSPAVLGKRFKCYKCGSKFYDLGKPHPLCPSCGANQLDGVIKATRKRRGKQRSAFVAKTEPLTIAPDETEDLHEVVDDIDSEYVLDMNDIVLEEHEDPEDKEER